MSLQLSYGLAVLLVGQLPTIKADGFGPSIQQETILATVHIINDKKKTFGAGVLLNPTGAFTYVLTAAHMVEGADSVDVLVFDAKSYPKAVKIYRSQSITRARDRQPDLAIVKLIGYKGESKGLKVCPLKGIPREKSFAVLASACGENLAPTLRQLTVKDTVRAIKPNEDRTGKYFRTAEKSVKGQSGGPLVDAKGQLLGICSGANGDHGYFCHIEEIHAFLNAHDLKVLLKTEP